MPAPWALDELDVDDVFTPLHDAYGHALPSSAMAHHDERPASSAEQAAADAAAEAERAAFEARVTERLAALRPAVEAEAYARGRTDGLAEGAAQGREQVTRVLEALMEATASVHAHEQRWLGNVEENLAAMAVTIARHVIQRELATDPAVVTDLVARALRQFPLERQLTVRLAADDHAIVMDALAHGGLDVPSSHEIRWLADPHIVRGGCLVEGRERVLDGRIDTALERTYRALGQVQA
jgi:flagellar biosynthesis/type III secretory pathway protein FliH